MCVAVIRAMIHVVNAQFSKMLFGTTRSVTESRKSVRLKKAMVRLMEILIERVTTATKLRRRQLILRNIFWLVTVSRRKL
jgi:hypothetical protein